MKINFDLNKLGPIQRKRWRITYHEIGHVIGYIHCKYPFDYVTIVPNGSRYGHVKSPDLDESNLTVQELEMCSIILLAGEAIDRRLFGWHDWYECGGNSDFKELYRLHKRKYESPPFLTNTCRSANYFFRLCRKVSVILSQYEKEIHVLAHELKKEKTLTYVQVLEILNRVDQDQVVFKVAISKRQRSPHEDDLHSFAELL